jgi:RHS repeat-associated protein
VAGVKHDPVTAGTACSDGDACNGAELCNSSGQCQAGTPVTCAASDQCHIAGTCSPSTGACSNPASGDGTSCDDGNVCTANDSCYAGTCKSGAAVTVDDSNPCTADSCDATGVHHTPVLAGTACGDNNPCNGVEACDGSGQCAAGTPVTCSALDQCHVAGTCNPTTGACSNPLVADGTSCSDGNSCTQADSCQKGLCSGAPTVCAALDACHDAGTCDQSTGTCSNPTSVNGKACSDGNACTANDSCQAGTCTGGSPVATNDSNPCTADSCDPSGGVLHTPLPTGTSCSDGNACNGNETCDGLGQCAAGVSVTCVAADQCHVAGTCDPVTGACSNVVAANGTTCSDGNACTQADACQNGICAGTSTTCAPLDVCHDAGTCDPATGACSNPVNAMCANGLPPDPALVAPPLDRTVVSTVYAQTSFLYTGTNPIQTGVIPSAIDPARVGEVRGRVIVDDGTPLSGVTITELRHAELGQTLSRIDGKYDYVSNGGGNYVFDYQKTGYLPVQRTFQLDWQQFVVLPDVVMIPLDSNVSPIALGAGGYQIARGSVVTDSDGTRQGTVLVPPGTQAVEINADGSSTPLSSMNVRVTEYTTGPNGPNRMPGSLPADSAYTYAVELSADEAIRSGAPRVEFSQPVIYYVDNFLNFPIGTTVPAGAYCRTCCGTWEAADSGKVVKVLSIAGGVAQLDTDGNNVADSAAILTAAGITSAEQQQIAALYPVGKSVWRVQLPHFSGWDLNWGIAPPNDAVTTTVKDALIDVSASCFEDNGGSQVDEVSQTLSEKLPITGTPYELVYQSDRVEGRSSNRHVLIPVSGPTIPASLERMDVDITVAARQFHASFDPAPNVNYDFTWDGLDLFGRQLQGAQPYNVKIGFVYKGIYNPTSRFGYKGNGSTITGVKGRQDLTLLREENLLPTQFDAKPLGLGGLNLDIHHAYDPSGVLYLGDGTTVRAPMLPRPINPFAGGGNTAANTGVGLAQAKFGTADAMAVAANGDLYVIDHVTPAIYKITPAGALIRVAGTGVAGYNGDEIPAIQAKIDPYLGRIAVAPECKGGFYFADSNNQRVRYVDPAGVIHTVGGTGVRGNLAEIPVGAVATQTNIVDVWGLAVGLDGSVFYASTYGPVFRIATDGTVTHVAGLALSNNAQIDGIPALNAALDPVALAVSPVDGALYIVDDNRLTDAHGNGRVRRVGSDGIIRTVVGGGTVAPAEGVPATLASFALSAVNDLAIGKDGSFYFVHSGQNRIWLIAPDGVMHVLTGNGPNGQLNDGDGGPAAASHFVVQNVAVAPDNTVYVTDGIRFRRISTPMPNLGPTQFIVPSANGREAFIFDAAGRHLRTVDSLTGSNRYQFGYDTSGALGSVTDMAGKVTTINRDSSGLPTSIVSPYGQVTALGTDSNGFLSEITDPAGHTTTLTYADGPGLLTSLRTPAGETSHFQYDSQGRLTGQANPAGGGLSLNLTEVPGQRAVLATTALGLSSTREYDSPASGFEHRQNTFPNGLSAIRSATQDGSVTTTLPNGLVTVNTMSGDPRFGMTAPYAASVLVTPPTGTPFSQNTLRSVALSDALNPFSVVSLTDKTTIDVNTGAAYSNLYTASSRTFNVTTPQFRNRVDTLDSKGRLAAVQRNGLTSTTFGYDTLGRVSTVQRGTRLRTFGYDSNGMLASITDPLGHVTGLTRDPVGNVTAQALPDGQLAHFSYDADGRLASVTPPGRPAQNFVHNAIGQLAVYQAPSVDEGGPNVTQYSYDVDNHPVAVALPEGQTVEIQYDSAGRTSGAEMPGASLAFVYSPTTGKLASASTSGGEQLAYAFNGVTPTSETWTGPVAGQVRWNFDKYQKLVSETAGGTTTSFAYELDGQVTSVGSLSIARDATTGLATSSTLRGATDTAGYDSFGQVLTYAAKYLTTSLWSTTYTRDALGRIATRAETQHGQTHSYVYTYDLRGRLSDVKRDNVALSHYGFDANGNRTSATTASGSATATYDAQDRVLAYGSKAFSYGADGELRQNSDTVSGQTTSYGYDALGNLTRVDLPTGHVVEYLIDATGRRVGKKLDGALVQGWLYRDSRRPIAELDATGNVVSRFVYADQDIDRKSPVAALLERVGLARSGRVSTLDLARAEYLIRGAQTLRIFTDLLGSPRLVVDVDTGNVVQEISYDEWGNATVVSGAGLQPLGFAGGLYDADTGLVHFGARDFDPRIGRWLSKEPTKTAGVLNLYEYAGGDPLNGADVDGLANLSVSDQTLLDSICGPNATGELHCTVTEFTTTTEQSVASAGSVFPLDGDGTQAGSSASTDLPAVSIDGNSSSGGTAVATGVGKQSANAAPVVNAGANITQVFPANNIALAGTATDDGLPTGLGLQLIWYTASGPTDAVFSSNTIANPTVSFPTPGVYQLAFAANDGEFTTTKFLTATITSTNAAPVIAASGPAQVNLGSSAHLSGTVTDDGLPAGGTLTSTWSKVSGPGAVAFTSPSQPTTDATFGAAGSYVLQLTANDGQLTSAAQLTITAIAVNHAPVVNVGPDQTLDPQAKSTLLSGTASDDGLPAGSALSYHWTLVSGPATVSFGSPAAPVTTVQFSYPGAYTLRLVASDSALEGSDDVTVNVGAPPGGTPSVVLSGVADDAIITKPLPLSGDISEGSWVLEYRLGGRDDVDTIYTTLATGTGAAHGVLGTFDPTILRNGLYTIRLSAKTSGGETTTTVAATVKGRMKIGDFTLAFTDLQVPVGGLPLQLLRTYDSRDRSPGDFGAGWRLSVHDIHVEKSGKTGAYWTQVFNNLGIESQFCLEPSRPATVSVTMPNGRVYSFRAASDPVCQISDSPITTPDVVWVSTSDPGNPTIKLSAEFDSDVFVVGSTGPVQLLTGAGDIWDPHHFKLTVENGTAYDIDQDLGVTRITDRNENTLDITVQGLINSSGKSVLFERDSAGRITKVTDPAGQSLSYEYLDGDLTAAVDRGSNRTTFAYAGDHYLQTIVDPLGRQAVRNDYDSSGRLTKRTDALGHTVHYGPNLPANAEEITDLLGNPTFLSYNDRGDVISQTDALGNVWLKSYDTRGNVLSETDPLGHTTTRTFDGSDNVLTETDPLGHTTSHTYNDLHQTLSTIDPLGNVSSNSYDSKGNLTQSIDALGHITTFTYDSRGGLTDSVDGLGHTSHTDLDASENPGRQVDAVGHATTFAYDADNRKVSETSTRTTASGPVTQTSSFTYDANGHLTKVVYPDGSARVTAWSASGNRSLVVDELGRQTSYSYDQLDRLVTTTFANGSSESATFDAAGRRTSFTNAAGNKTSYSYDALGRVTSTQNADGSSTSTSYDAAGNAVGATDELGHITSFAFDESGQQIATTDALGNVTQTAYDAAGRATGVTDPLGRTTTRVYDAVGQLLRTVDGEGKSTATTYDALGQQTSTTDGLGRTTAFAYDAAGRLTALTDALGQMTKYTYDELGNRLTQVDPNGHTTSFEYDARDHTISRSLPGGSGERMGYDLAGHLQSRVDFEGRLVTYSYDQRDHLISRSYADGSTVNFTYNDAGLRASSADARGTRRYSYDTRGRIVQLTNPDGSSLSYGRDARGNEISLSARTGTATPALVTKTSFDAAGLPEQVTDALNRNFDIAYDADGDRVTLAYPNATTTTYGYNGQNRLLNLVTQRVAGANPQLQSYAYTLDATGKSTQIDDVDAVTHKYSYDALNRLTSEQTTGGAAPYSRSFSYDPVGNRVTQTKNDAATSSYAYDSRDRLQTENSTSYSYDRNGNVTAKSGEATYSYDLDDRLVSVTMTNGSRVDHTYDPDGHRVQTRLTLPSGTAKTTRYLVDPSGLSHVVAETDGATGALSAAYVRLGDELLSVLRPDGHGGFITRYVHHDGLGSVRALSDETGSRTDTKNFEAFGSLISSSGTDPLPYGFAGEPFDATTHLADHRARWMDPRLGRFMSMDPVLARPGGRGMTPYWYANDDPVGNTDPTGLYTPAFGRAVEEAVKPYYEMDHPGDLIIWGQPITYTTVGAPGGLPLIKPDIVNLTGTGLSPSGERNHGLWVEVKPFSVYGITTGAAQQLVYTVVLGMAPAQFGSNPILPEDWTPRGQVISVKNDMVFTFNVGGLLFYTTRTDLVHEFEAVTSVAALRTLLKSTQFLAELAENPVTIESLEVLAGAGEAGISDAAIAGAVSLGSLGGFGF